MSSLSRWNNSIQIPMIAYVHAFSVSLDICVSLDVLKEQNLQQCNFYLIFPFFCPPISLINFLELSICN